MSKRTNVWKMSTKGQTNVFWWSPPYHQRVIEQIKRSKEGETKDGETMQGTTLLPKGKKVIKGSRVKGDAAGGHNNKQYAVAAKGAPRGQGARAQG